MFDLFGVFEDVDVPDTAWGDVRGLWEPQGSFKFFFSQSEIRSPLKNKACGQKFSMEGKDSGSSHYSG